MATEAPGIQNKGLLIVAVILAAIVVVVYNVHIQSVRSAGKGEKVALIRVARDMKSGDKITEKEIYKVEVDKGIMGNLGNVVPWENLNFVKANTLNQPVQKDQWLLWQHITGSGGYVPASAITPGMVGKPIAVDPVNNLGESLVPGERVNVKGYLPAPGGGKLQARVFLEGAKVLQVGGRMSREMIGTNKPGSADVGMRTYRSVMLEVSPKISDTVDNILTHVRGPVFLDLLNDPKLDTDANVPRIPADLLSAYGGSAEAPREGSPAPPE